MPERRNFLRLLVAALGASANFFALLRASSRGFYGSIGISMRTYFVNRTIAADIADSAVPADAAIRTAVAALTSNKPE